jgi:hypothetical protein
MFSFRFKCWICLIFFPLCYFGQNSLKEKETKLKPDSVRNIDLKHSPKTATLLSLLPGAGQVYNHKYWKVPVIYVAFAGLTYLVITNNRGYRTYYNAEKNYPGPETDQQFLNDQTNKNDYLHALDLDIIAMGAVYLLNLVDAAVDAHLYTFDVGKDLSLQWFPSIFYSSQNNLPKTGLQLTLKF